jgi:predicted nucleotidyltransferase
MERQSVLATLKRLEPALRRDGVGSLYLYGSYARDEAGPQSDIDIFVDAANENFFKFENFMRAYALLEDAFPLREIGYGAREDLSPFIRYDVEREAIKIF